MTTIPAPSRQMVREEWSDADFDLRDDQPLHTGTDRDPEDDEDWDAEMDLGKTGQQALPSGITSAPPLSQAFIIRPSQNSSEGDDDEDEGVSTIKVAILTKPAVPISVPQSSQSFDDDFEDAFSLPADLTQLSLAPLSLSHRISKTSLEWGDKDQTSSSQSSDAYSSLGFADASPSSNSTSVSLPVTEDDDDDDDELEGLVIPSGIFESGKGARQLTKLLEMKKHAEVPDRPVRPSRAPEEDFESGLIIDDDHELSPSRLLSAQQSKRVLNTRTRSLPTQRQPSSLRPPSRLRHDGAKSPTFTRPPPSRNQTISPTSASSFLTSKSGNLRGQKSHSGFSKPASPPANPRKLTRKASLSSLMEASNQASGSGSASAGPSRAGYEEPTAASRAKSYKSREFKVPPTRPTTPSNNPAALRLTMPTVLRSKSRPTLSSVFNGPPSASGPQSPMFRSMSPVPPRPSSAHLPPRPPSSQSATRPSVTRVLKRPKRQRVFGDGTELDGFDDLPTDRDQESRFRVQPKGYGNRVPGASYSPAKPEKGTIRRKRREGSDTMPDIKPQAPSPKKRKQPASPLPAAKKKPTLIRNLSGVGASRVVGDMKWNPQSMRWEGNEHVLRDFDAAVGSSTRPALITHLTGSSIGSPVGSFANGARIVGNMMFDPSRMCWVSTLPPEEEEPDVFADLADDEDDGDAWEEKGATIRASAALGTDSLASSTSTTIAPSSASSSPARSEHSFPRSGPASESDSERDRGSRASMVVCDVDEAFIERCRAAEARHRQEMRGWNLSSTLSTPNDADPFAGQRIDRRHLHEIRELATRKYS
ncbi:unnamed protein product [Mycena citricolor]|uniref:Uncharacterized protein n=1 Tax=Mycena citricolor TaxID=2018698 RepID=A0AAD2GYQ8_9AGAR|nr:unnamed protein product [Mycena citricolor]